MEQELMRVDDIPKVMPWITARQLRDWIFRDKEFERVCIRRAGRKVLVKTAELRKWIDTIR